MFRRLRSSCSNIVQSTTGWPEHRSNDYTRSRRYLHFHSAGCVKTQALSLSEGLKNLHSAQKLRFQDFSAFVIHADIPGVKPENIEVSMEAGVLTVKGEKETESKTEKEGYKRIERTSGSFYRRFSLPDSADGDAINAKCKHGVLEIVIPKREAIKPKRINVVSEE